VKHSRSPIHSKKHSVKKSKKFHFESNMQPECDHPATMQGLEKWFVKMFEQLGWMILAKEYGYDEKIACYKKSLGRLHDKLECKIKSVHDEDKKDDLKIMHGNVMTLINHVKNDFQ